MGFFSDLGQNFRENNLFGKRTFDDYRSKKNIIIEGENFQDVPFANIKKITGGSNVTYTEGAKDLSTQNYYSYPSGEGQVIIQTKKEMNTDPDVSQASEKGFGGTGTIATGEGAVASSEENSNPILTYALIGAGILAGVFILKK